MKPDTGIRFTMIYTDKSVLLGTIDCRNISGFYIENKITNLLLQTEKYKNLSSHFLKCISKYIYEEYVDVKLRYATEKLPEISYIEVYDTTVDQVVSKIREEIVLYILER